ncbi:hypothetical protein ACHAWF_003459 [Thalassiosira exigua]
MCQPTAGSKSSKATTAAKKRALYDGESFRFPHSDGVVDDSVRAPAPSSPAAASSPPPPSPPLHPAHVPYRRAASHVLSLLKKSGVPSPEVGIVCGSGLSGLSDALDDSDSAPRLTVPYHTIPGFPNAGCTVAGHAGELVVGTLRGVPTICFRGRFHGYEGHELRTVALPVRVMRCLGVKLVLVTNAAGGLKDAYRVGDVAVIRDHIALPLLAAGNGPLSGPNDDELGPRFPPTSDLYDKSLQTIVVNCAKSLEMSEFLHLDGTYAYVTGPQYESKSECAMLRTLGADAVGMSTVPEILAAHHAGMAVLCLSLITNKAVIYDEGGSDDDDEEEKKEKTEHANHAEVLRAVKGRGEDMVKLVGEVVKKCGEEYLPKMKELKPIRLETEGRVVGGEEEEVGEKGRGFTLCPYRAVKGVLSAPAHCLLMGGAILAAGALLGAKLSKR